MLRKFITMDSLWRGRKFLYFTVNLPFQIYHFHIPKEHDLLCLLLIQ
jgi:hypothetical protein